MAIDLNCECSETFDRRTLGELYQMVRDGLGFLDLLTVGVTRTLEDLRDDIKSQLGLATPMNIQVKTAGDMIDDMTALLGNAAATGTSTPGFQAQCLAFLNKAQQNAWRRIELDRGAETPPATLALLSDVTEKVDAEITFSIAMGLAKAFYTTPDAKIYLDEAEKHFADWLQRHPPNIDDLVNKTLQSAHRTIVRTYAQGAYGALTDSTFASDGDFTSVDSQPVLLLALATLKAKLGHGDAKIAMQLYTDYLQDQLKRSPPNAATAIKQALRNSQEILFRKYDVFRMERWYTWTLTEGQRFYGIPDNDERLGIIPAPVIVSAVATPTGGTLGAGTYTYWVVAGNADGTTTLSDPVQVTIASGTTNKVTITWSAPTVPAGTNSILEYNVYGRSGSAAFIAGVGGFTLSYNDLGSISPGGAPLPPTENTTFPGACLKTLDPRSVHWVGISQGDNSWRELRRYPIAQHYSVPNNGIPTHYDIRQCIELWPNPIAGWHLRIKGKFGLDAFTADHHYCTIDWQAVLLQTLADMKVFFKLPDGQFAKMEANAYIGTLVAGSHMTARSIPGTRELSNAVRPVLSGPFVP